MDTPEDSLEEQLSVCKQKLEALKRENEELRIKSQLFKDGNNEPSISLSPKECGRIMSEDVSSENRYSRLMALQKMGVVTEYTKIMQCSVLIIGIGGIGIVAAEMLCRCGIGELILVDNDSVELANMNRMFYRPDQCGMTKVEAAKQTLTVINPEVKIRGYNMDVTHLSNYDHLLSLIQSDPIPRQNLVLCCVDNFSARMSVNQLCLQASVPWLESGLSENAVSGHIQFVAPGVTACFSCAPPLVVATGLEASLKKEGVCVASLPTTSAIIAGLLVQNALKYLLKFGKCSEVLAYNSIQDYFSSYSLKPNPNCSAKLCVQRQGEMLSDTELNKIFCLKEDETLNKQEISKENEWKIEVIDEVAELNEKTIEDMSGLDKFTNKQLSNMLKDL